MLAPTGAHHAILWTRLRALIEIVPKSDEMALTLLHLVGVAPMRLESVVEIVLIVPVPVSHVGKGGSHP